MGRMTFRKAIQTLPDQLRFEPEIRFSENLPRASIMHSFTIAGMGGSALSADLIAMQKSNCDLVVHRMYGLPDGRRSDLFIASSYSGNTEETLDAFEAARAANMCVAVVSTGGELLARADAAKIPYVQLPNAGIEPRSAVGFSARALLAFLGDPEALAEIAAAASLLDFSRAEREGEKIAAAIAGRFPVIYASARTIALAYNWKSRFNETGKIAAFASSIPEANHNEIMGFDFAASADGGGPFAAIFLMSAIDHPRVRDRMRATETLLASRGMSVVSHSFSGESSWTGIFQSLLVCDFAAYRTARVRGLDPDNEKTIEDFKKEIGTRGKSA